MKTIDELYEELISIMEEFDAPQVVITDAKNQKYTYDMILKTEAEDVKNNAERTYRIALEYNIKVAKLAISSNFDVLA